MLSVMPDFGFNTAQILGAVGSGRNMTGGLPDVPFLSQDCCVVLDVTLTVLVIVAQMDIMFQTSTPDCMPRLEPLSPVWPYLIAPEAGCRAM